MKPARLRRVPLVDQRGMFGVLYAMLLPVMLGMIGLAIDLSMLYARGHELQVFADATAIAAARALDGTANGVDEAKDRASMLAANSQVRMGRRAIAWSNAALSFGASPDGPWIGADAASAQVLPTLRFAKVDTAGVDAQYGRVATAFMRMVGVSNSIDTTRRAVAGRKDTNLSPLAVCALNSAEIAPRTVSIAGSLEGVEFGFRRGVTYNLLKLNPNGTSPRSFLINPLDFAPAPSVASHLSDAAVRPFVCTGHMPAPPIGAGSTLYVREPFPVSLVPELNSRFGLYTDGSLCTTFAAAPDFNVRDFRGGYPGFWITNVPVPVKRSAEPYIDGGRLVTVADTETAASGSSAASYGTLWSFARPRRYNSDGTLGSTFNRNHWASLYPVASPPATAAAFTPDDSPYGLKLHMVPPAPLQGASERRVLNVPLLECPVSGASARVLGIGRFLMTTPATQTPAGVYGEFGGLTTYASMTASAVLYK